MPTIFIVFGFIFRFFSDDHLPIHVHVVKDGHEAKFNVEPKVELVYNYGFKRQEVTLIESIVEENVEVIVTHWNDYFSQKTKL